jgi:hypothetical protein
MWSILSQSEIVARSYAASWRLVDLNLDFIRPQSFDEMVQCFLFLMSSLSEKLASSFLRLFQRRFLIAPKKTIDEHSKMPCCWNNYFTESVSRSDDSIRKLSDKSLLMMSC